MGKIDKLLNRTELTGTTDLITPYGSPDSSPRLHMVAAQSQQAMQPKKPDIPISLTGYEAQMTKTTMAITMPCDAIIEDIISHHVSAVMAQRDSITKTIIYQDIDTGIYGTIELEGYFRAHDVFGAKLNLTAEGQRLRPGMQVRKGTVLAHSNGANMSGVYTTSMTAEVANLSLNGVIEDGLIVSDEFLERASPVAMAVREAETGKERYFVGAYSENGVFRAFPGPGEKVREDNLLFATRNYDPLLDSIYMLEDMIDEVDFAYDECVFAPPECTNGKVVDITVFSSPQSSRLRQTPPSMEESLNVYREHKGHYCSKIVDIYRRLRKQEGQRLKLSPKLEELMTYALADKPNDQPRSNSYASAGTVQYTHKAKQIDEWYVSLEIAWMYDLSYGAKLADTHGMKGVVCEIRPRSEMPRDDFGNIADVVQYGSSVFARMNVGQEYERYINAACRDVTKDMRKMNENGDWLDAFNHGMGLLKIVSREQYDHFVKVKNTDLKKKEWVDSVTSDILRILMRPDAGVLGRELITAIREYRRPDKSSITYVNYDGNVVRTEKEALIGPKQMIVLDKSSFKPMAVAVARRQQHGLPATTNKRTKVAFPTNRQPPRSWGETENRNLCASIGGEAVMYQIDQSTNPDATRNALESMLRESKPFRKHKHLDRDKVPLGGSRTIQFVKNLVGAMGVALKTIYKRR